MNAPSRQSRAAGLPDGGKHSASEDPATKWPRSSECAGKPRRPPRGVDRWNAGHVSLARARSDAGRYRSSKPILQRGGGGGGPRRTTRATVSVVGPGGKIATVASADMQAECWRCVLFLNGVGAAETGRSLLAAPPGTVPLSVLRPRGARTGDEVLQLEETQPPFRRRPTGRAVRRAYPSRAPSACETRGSRRGRNKESVGDGAR